MAIALKRVYDDPMPSDGTRVLVDRLWPRGLTKERAALDAWLRDLAPSNELRNWFHAHREQWSAFRKRYLHELSDPAAAEDLEKLYRLTHEEKKVTLLYGSKNEEQNNAVVLKDLLEGMRKPPSGTGPAGARAVLRQAKRMPRTRS